MFCKPKSLWLSRTTLNYYMASLKSTAQYTQNYSTYIKKAKAIRNFSQASHNPQKVQLMVIFQVECPFGYLMYLYADVPRILSLSVAVA